MSDIDIEQIRARAEAATPGPWEYGNTGEPLDLAARIEWVADTLGYDNEERHLWSAWIEDEPGRVTIPALTGDGERARENAEFIAHAREDVPALLAEVERLRVMHRGADIMLDSQTRRARQAEAERDKLMGMFNQAHPTASFAEILADVRAALDTGGA